MRMTLSRRVLMPAGACTLVLGLAVPSVTSATAAAGAVRPAAGSAIPSPYAPHSGKVVPGMTGAAARRADPPVSAATRWAQDNATSQRAGRHLPAPGGIKPAVASWTGTLHNDWGTFPSQTMYGAQATQALNPNTKLSSSDPDTVYSPTLDPSGITCIEMSTIYQSVGDKIGAWDWCAANPSFAKATVVNSSFLATYTTTIGGQPFYTVQDVQTNPTTNSWTSYLFNYTTGAWDTYYTSANTSKLSNSGGGWDMAEVYTDYNSSTHEGDYCTETSGSNLETTGLQYQLSPGGSWTAASTSNTGMNVAYPAGAQLGCSNATYWLPTANSNWRVTNGTHAADELVGAGSGKCVDTAGQAFTNGTKEEIYTCHNGPGQTWTWNSLGELTVDGGAYCLDATNYGTTPGTKIQLWKCNNTTNQEWTFSVKHTIVGVGSGLCLDVTGAGTANDTQLDLWNCTDGTNQQWSWS